MLAAIALSVATGILVKSDKLHYAWITGLPLLWLITITSTAAWQKITSDNIRLGFFSAANDLTEKLANGSLPAAKAAIAPQLILNLQIDGWITLCFVSLLWVIVLDMVRVCYKHLAGQVVPPLTESAHIPSRLVEEWIRD